MIVCEDVQDRGEPDPVHQASNLSKLRHPSILGALFAYLQNKPANKNSRRDGGTIGRNAVRAYFCDGTAFVVFATVYTNVIDIIATSRA